VYIGGGGEGARRAHIKSDIALHAPHGLATAHTTHTNTLASHTSHTSHTTNTKMEASLAEFADRIQSLASEASRIASQRLETAVSRLLLLALALGIADTSSIVGAIGGCS
jgi:hypothetical protein